MRIPLLATLGLLILLAAVVPAGAQQPTSVGDRHPLPAAVLALTTDGQSRIVVVDPDGTTRVLTDGPHDVAPVADPDGVRASFVRVATEGDAEGELGLVDLATGSVEMTGLPINRRWPILWQDRTSLIASTDAGIVRLRPDLRSAEFVAGTDGLQSAMDVWGPPPAAADDPVPTRILAAKEGPHPLQLLELTGTDAPTVLWSSPELQYTLPTAAWGPHGSVAFLTTISSSGFGTYYSLHFLDAEGDAVRDAAYGGDGGIHLRSRPLWRPSGGAVLFGGVGQQRFPGPGSVNPPATLLLEGPGEEEDRTVTTRERPRALQPLGWRPDGTAIVAMTDAPDADAAYLLLGVDGEVLHEVPMPGDYEMHPSGNDQYFWAPNADLLPPIRRVGGETRMATAARVSQTTFPGGADGGALAEHVVLARADTYADALAGAPLARALDAPLLLTSSQALHPDAAEEIERLGASQVVLLGGEAALGPAVEADLRGQGLQVRRIAGADRFATAAAIAEELPASDRVVLVEGADVDPARGWPDAVSAGPLAASTGSPLLLTTTDALPEATARALGEIGPAVVTVVGGTAAVAEETATHAADAAGGTYERIAGATRTATAVAVAEAMISEGAGSAESLWLATATDHPDALAGGPAVAADGGVLLLVPEHVDDPAFVDFLASTQSRVARLIGGPAVIGGQRLGATLLSAGLGGPDAEAIDL